MGETVHTSKRPARNTNRSAHSAPGVCQSGAFSTTPKPHLQRTPFDVLPFDVLPFDVLPFDVR
jgi:hypothetical protein